MSPTPIQDTNATVAAISRLDDRAREDAVRAFVEDRYRLLVLNARTLARRVGRTDAGFIDELASIGAEVLLGMVRSYLDNPDTLVGAPNFEAKLFLCTQNAVHAFCDSEAGGAPASGMAAARRRHRKLIATRDRLRAEMGAEPATRDVVAAANEELRATRADVVRQGMVTSAADLHLPSRTADLDGIDPRHATAADEAALCREGFLLHPVEGRRFVNEVIALAGARSPRLGEVARAWLIPIYLGPGDVRVSTTEAIARHYGVTVATVRADIRTLRRLATQLLAERLGITEADYLGQRRTDAS